MTDRMKWEDAYKLWQTGSLSLPASVSAPITPEIVAVNDDREGYVYGYDWLPNTDAQQRKNLISKNPIEFLYFAKPANKGTIMTLHMLAEAQDEEERAAVWIAATAFDLAERQSGQGIARFAQELNSAANTFLIERYGCLWHHAMRKLVPKIMIPYPVLGSMKCDGADAVMGLIQTNVLLIEGSYTPLLYASIDENDPKFQDVTAEHRLHRQLLS